MDKQLHAIEAAALTLHMIFCADSLIPRVRCTHGELIHQCVIAYLKTLLRSGNRQQLIAKRFIEFAVYPTFTEVEVQLLKWDRCRHRILQGTEASHHSWVEVLRSQLHILTCCIHFDVVLLADSVYLLNDVTRYELSGDFIFLRQRIPIHITVQLHHQFALAHTRQCYHVGRVGITIVIQALRQRIVSTVGIVYLVHGESHGLHEDVSLSPCLSVLHFECQ